MMESYNPVGTDPDGLPLPLWAARVRSPLLAGSLLISFPPGTEMFHFPGFATTAYVFS